MIPLDRVDPRMKASWICLLLAACGEVEAPRFIIDARPGDTACVAETDTAFCARLAKTCEMVSDTDNCGQPRAADCGTCTGADACTANVCTPPVCGATFQATGTQVSSVFVGRQTALCGASSTGQSILGQPHKGRSLSRAFPSISRLRRWNSITSFWRMITS